MAESTISRALAIPKRQRKPILARLDPYLFMLPYLLLFVGFLLLPAVAGVAVSLSRWDIVGEPTFAGLSNYQFIVAEPRFQAGLLHTIYYTILSVVPFVVLALALALFLNQPYRIMGLVRTAIFAPFVAMVSVVAIIWKYLYDANWGVINYYLQAIGLPKVDWLADPGWAMPSIAIASVWWLIGANTVIYLAGLQDIPDDYYEAARIDGANSWQLLRHITMPLLINVHAFIIPITIIGTFRVFGQVYVMTEGGPRGATRVLLQYIYEVGFREFYMGRAAAAAVVLLLITLVLTLIQLRAMRQI